VETLSHRAVSQSKVLKVEGVRQGKYEGWNGKQGNPPNAFLLLLLLVFISLIGCYSGSYFDHN